MRGHRGAKGRRRVGLGLPSAFTSDGNSNESDSSDLDGDHAGKRSHSVRAADSRLMPEEEEEVTPPIKGKRLQKSKGGAGQLPRPARRTSRKKGLNSKLSSDEDAPVHRKARTIRSLRQIDQHREREVIHKRGAAKQESSSMSRPSCSAKKKRYYLGESDRTDSEGEEDTDVEEEEEEDESSEEEESSEKASEDSEDELIPRTRRGAKQISPKSKKTAANRHSLKRTKSKIVSEEEEEGEGSGREEVASDSDPSPPSKRCRLQRSSTPKKQLRKSPSAREPAPRRKPRPGKASGSSSRETRNRGQQRVTYTEEYYSDDYDEGEGEEGGRSSSTSGEQHSDSDGRDGGLEASSVSSRGRVRKLTARARASLRVA